MPKPGYTNIIVKEEIRSYLERLAKAEGFRTVNQLLEAMIRVDPKLTGVYPRVDPAHYDGNYVPAQIPHTPLPTDYKTVSISRKMPFLIAGSFGKESGLVGSPGFEPGSRTPEARSLDHASRRPLVISRSKPEFKAFTSNDLLPSGLRIVRILALGDTHKSFSH